MDRGVLSHTLHTSRFTFRCEVTLLFTTICQSMASNTIKNRQIPAVGDILCPVLTAMGNTFEESQIQK